MRVTLLYNPTSGDEVHEPERLVEMVRDAGYDIRHRSIEGKWTKALERKADLIVVAGGDGTVGKVAKRLAHSGRPMAVLPIGTANNIAKTLGIVGDAREVIAAWRGADPAPLDLGVAVAPWGTGRFVESVGGGIFAEVIARHEAVSASPAILGRETDRALHLIGEVTGSSTAEHWAIEADGQDLSGRYVAVEVLNTRFAGPNIPLAPDADPGDGMLEVVLIAEGERDVLLDYVSSRVESGAAELAQLPVHRARQVRLVPPPGVPLHLDDEPWPEDPDERHDERTIAISVEHGAVAVLTGAPG